MGKKSTTAKGKQPNTRSTPKPKSSKSTASPATKLSKAKQVPLPRESSPDLEDKAPTASEDEEDLSGAEDFDEDAFMKLVQQAQAGEGDDSDDDVLAGSDDEEMMEALGLGEAAALDGEGESDDDEEAGEESEDVSPQALERMMALLGDDVSASDIALLKQMKGEGSDDEDDEDDEDDSDEDEEDEEEIAAALQELEDASDVDADAEDMVPAEKTTTNDQTALLRVLSSIALPASTTFFDTLTLTNPEPLGGEQGVNAEDDLQRELAFYKQSLWAALRAETLHDQFSVPFHRPSDYFAEMVKTDAHMAKLRQGMLDEQAGMKASEEARRLRDAKKFGKKVQQERLREREVEKKRMKEGVEGLKKKRKNDSAFGGEDFEVALEDALSSQPQKRQKTKESERPGSARRGLSRNSRDKKFGFGGGEGAGRRAKQNNLKMDEEGGGGRGGGGGGRGRGGSRGRGGARGGRGGGAGGGRGGPKRLGKSRRQ
ncbi:hypothetical protein JCM11641_006201 [Rhodosporidiobolus odoratus]